MTQTLNLNKTTTTKAKPKAPVAKTAKNDELKPLNKPVALGCLVRDRASGLIGIAHAKVEMMTGNIQWAVMPQGDGTELKKAHCIDYHLLETVGEGVAGTVPPVDTSASIVVGEEVEDQVSGLKGIAVERTTFLNGCVYYGVQPKAKKGEQSLPDTLLFEHKRLKRIGSGLSKTLAVPTQPLGAPSPVQAKERRTGGPSRSLPRMA